MKRGKRISNQADIESTGNECKEKSDYELLEEQYDSLQSTVDACTEMIENRTFEISSGGLALSLTVISILNSTIPQRYAWMAAVMWFCFTLCIISHYISQYIARKDAEVLRDRVGEMIKQKQNYDAKSLNQMYTKKQRCLKFFNRLSLFALLIGIVFLVLFTFFCVF